MIVVTSGIPVVERLYPVDAGWIIKAPRSRLEQPSRTSILPYRDALRKGQKGGVLMQIENHFGENPTKHVFGEKSEYCLAKRVV